MTLVVFSGVWSTTAVLAQPRQGAGASGDAPETVLPTGEVPDDPCAELRAASDHADQGDPGLVNRGDVRGMFFPMPTARLVLCEVRELRLRRRESGILSEEIRQWSARTDLLREQVRLAVEAKNELGQVVDAAERRAREAEADRDSWWRSPVLWFAVGAVVTVALVVTTAVALHDVGGS